MSATPTTRLLTSSRRGSSVMMKSTTSEIMLRIWKGYVITTSSSKEKSSPIKKNHIFTSTTGGRSTRGVRNYTLGSGNAASFLKSTRGYWSNMGIGISMSPWFMKSSAFLISIQRAWASSKDSTVCSFTSQK